MAGRLQHELKKRQPFAQPADEAVLNLLRTADRVQIRLDRFLRTFGLTASQYNVLRILRGEGKPLPVLEIAGRTITEVPGITGLIDRLERAGLVCRIRCPEDRRVIHVSILPPALELLARIDEPLAHLQRELVGGLTKAELAELNRLLEKARTVGGA
jgi:MarR family transcriptional regulator, 2-MHQ and catechol-resistance regulon repressor